MTYELFFTTLFWSKFYFPTKIRTSLGTFSRKPRIIYAPLFPTFSKNSHKRPGVRFSNVPVTFRAEIKYANENPKKTEARILAIKRVHFILVTGNVIQLSPKVSNLRHECEQHSVFRAC